jgi:hypothetical protein
MDYTPQNMEEIYKRLQTLTEKAKAELVKEGFADNQIYVEVNTRIYSLLCTKHVYLAILKFAVFWY